MFERFTSEARRVVVRAQEHSRRLDSADIDTGHLLLGLVRAEQGVGLAHADRCLASEALAAMEVSPEVVRARVEALVGDGGGSPPSGHLPFTPAAKTALGLSLRESRLLDQDFIGTEHLLLGLVAEGDGVAAQVLGELGVDLDRARRSVIAQLTVDPAPPEDAERPAGATGSGHGARAVVSDELVVVARPDDVAWATARLCDHLGQRFEVVPASSLAIDDVADRVRGCAALVVVVGPSWLPLPAEDDAVRTSLDVAVTGDRPITVVLVDGTPMPDPADLPEYLRPIVRGESRTLTLEGFDDEVRALVEHVDGLLPAQRRPASDRGAGFG